MSVEKTVVTVIIAGDEYHIRAEATPEYTRECARYVDATIAEITRSSRTVMEPHKAAILAALSMADQLFQTRRELEHLYAQSTSTVGKLSEEIAAKLAALDLASDE
ncbi:MAG TPA: cell division protein ZapA [Longimicrobiales bacterium]